MSSFKVANGKGCVIAAAGNVSAAREGRVTLRPASVSGQINLLVVYNASAIRNAAAVSAVVKPRRVNKASS